MLLTVQVHAAKFEEWGEIHVANFVTRELRKAGAPIGDGLFPFKIERGRVIIEVNDFGDLSVTWSDDEQA